MCMTDPIADMFVRIRNAGHAKHTEVDIPLSNIKLKIAQLMKEEGYIKDYKVLKELNHGTLKIYLKYSSYKKPIINKIIRVSKPGRRVYVKKDEIPRVLNGIGISILSTPKGILTNKQAVEAGVGGELICNMW